MIMTAEDLDDAARGDAAAQTRIEAAARERARRTGQTIGDARRDLEKPIEAATPSVTLHDLARSATDVNASRKIAAEVARRRAENPDYTITDLRRELETRPRRTAPAHVIQMPKPASRAHVTDEDFRNGAATYAQVIQMLKPAGVNAGRVDEGQGYSTSNRTQEVEAAIRYLFDMAKRDPRPSRDRIEPEKVSEAMLTIHRSGEVFDEGFARFSRSSHRLAFGPQTDFNLAFRDRDIAAMESAADELLAALYQNDNEPPEAA